MGKLPNRSEMSTADAPADQFQGDKHKNAKSSNKLLDKGVNPVKKKSGGKPPMSPILQVMKAVTDHALNPKKKKAPKKSMPGGPSKANRPGIIRKDSDDGANAEVSGEAGGKK